MLLGQYANVSLRSMLLLLSLQVLDIVYFSNTTTPGGFLPQGATGMSPILFRCWLYYPLISCNILICLLAISAQRMVL